jgi:hypothetical protein
MRDKFDACHASAWKAAKSDITCPAAFHVAGLIETRRYLKPYFKIQLTV